MDDYLTRVAEAVRDACAETCNEQHTIAERRPIPATICAMHIGHIDLPATIASVPKPEPVAWLFRHPAAGYLTATDSGNATDDGVFPVYAEPVAAQPAVPEAPQMADYEAVIADHARLVRELDVALNGDSAARQASLCDLVAQVKAMKVAVPIEMDSFNAPWMTAETEPDVAYADGWNACRDAMLAAAPETPQPAAPLGTSQNPICLAGEEMARLAEFAGISVDNREDAAGILLWVGEHRDDAGTAGYGLCASLEDYPEEGCYPLVELPRQQPADDAAALRSDIRAMASMLQAREWAEHVSTDPVVTDLEVQITELVGTATALRGQNAALVAALKAIDDQASHAGDEFGGPLAVATKEGLGDRDELLELAGIADGYLESISLTAEQALASAKGGAT